MRTRRTTTCCSALAIVVAMLAPADAGQAPTPTPAPTRTRMPRLTTAKERGPLGLFPTRPAWTLALRNLLSAPPAYDQHRAYYPLEGGRLAAYDLDEGTRRWVIPIAVTQQPAAGGGLVFIPQDDGVQALHGEDGTLAWHLPFAARLAAPLVWDTGWLVAAATDGTVFAYRASDAQLIWQRNVGSPAHARPALAGDRLYVPTEDGRVVALRLESGDPVWERRLGGAASEVLPLDDRIYVGSRDNYFYALKAVDGAVDWRWRTGADVIGLPAVDADNVYFVSLDNVLRALDRQHGVQQWKTALPLRPTSGPLKAGDALIVSGLALAVRAFNIKDGKALGEITGTTELAAPPFVLDTGSPLGPTIVMATRDVAKGATLTGVVRAVEPTTSQVAALPNAIVPPPKLPVAPASE